MLLLLLSFIGLYLKLICASDLEWQLCNFYFNRTYCASQAEKKFKPRQVDITPRTSGVLGSDLRNEDVPTLESSIPTTRRHILKHTGPFEQAPDALESDSAKPPLPDLQLSGSQLPVALVLAPNSQLASVNPGKVLGILVSPSLVTDSSNSDSYIDPLKSPPISLPAIPRILNKQEQTGEVNMSPAREIVMASTPIEEAKIKQVEKEELTKLKAEGSSQTMDKLNAEFLSSAANQDSFDVRRGKPEFKFPGASELALLKSSNLSGDATVKLESLSGEGVIDSSTQKQTGPVSSDPANKLAPTGVRPNWRPVKQGPFSLTPISNSPGNFIKRPQIFPSVTVTPTTVRPDHEACPVMKPEYDRICFVRPTPQTVVATKKFCDAFKNNCQNLIKSLGGLIDPAARLKAVQPEEKPKPTKGFDESENHESCIQLKPEYDDNCLSEPSPDIAEETAAFCNAYVSMCKSLMETPEWNIKPDYTIYCRKHLERFEFVCPKPFRFGKYTEEATKFCDRYMRRCPSSQVPSEPVHFKKWCQTARECYIQKERESSNTIACKFSQWKNMDVFKFLHRVSVFSIALIFQME